MYQQILENDLLLAARQSIQIFAHDVRGPFRMLELIVTLLDAEKDPEEAKKFLHESLPHIQNTILAVDGMITDVLAINSEPKLMTESISSKILIESTLKDMFRLYPKFNAKIKYQLQHKHNVVIDILKIKRVLMNIFENAFQAITHNKNGLIWVTTKKIVINEKNFILFCIGNNGKAITNEDLPRIFDLFFTTKKNGGTGLGLAIARKIIISHGGNIWCESNQNKSVEFYFTLPMHFTIN